MHDAIRTKTKAFSRGSKRKKRQYATGISRPPLGQPGFTACKSSKTWRAFFPRGMNLNQCIATKLWEETSLFISRPIHCMHGAGCAVFFCRKKPIGFEFDNPAAVQVVAPPDNPASHRLSGHCLTRQVPSVEYVYERLLSYRD